MHDTTVEEVLRDARKRGCELWTDGKSLRYRCVEGALTDALRASLLLHRDALIRALEQPLVTAAEPSPERFVPIDLSILRPFWRMMTKTGWVKTDVANATHILKRIDGPLDVGALEKALHRLHVRHDILNGRVGDADGKLEIRYEQIVPFELRHIDLSALQAEVQTANCEAELVRSIWSPIDVACHLTRGFLIKLDPQCHIFGLVVHHICADQQSIQIIEREIDAGYARFRGDGGIEDDARPVQFVEQNARTVRWLASNEAAETLATVRRRLDHAPPTLLPDDFRRGEHVQGGERAVTARLEQKTLRALRDLRPRNGFTLPVLLIAAQAVAISARTGANDVTIMVVTTGRVRPEQEGIVGAFAGEVPHRLRTPSDATLLTVAENARATCIEMLECAEVPPPLYRDLMWKARASHNAPWFNFTHTPRDEEVQTLGVRMVGPSPPSETDPGHGAPYCYGLAAYMEDDGLKLEMTYSPSRYRYGTMQEFMDLLIGALDAVARQSRLTVGEFAASRLTGHREVQN